MGKTKLTNGQKKDFDNFWDLWDSIFDYALSMAKFEDKEDKFLSLSNQMMVAAYAANLWFNEKNKKG